MARIVFILACVVAAACSSDSTSVREVCEPLEASAPALGDSTTYVVDSVHLPATAAEAAQWGFNLDLDPQGRADNALGQILSTVAIYIARDLDGTLAGLIEDGTIMHLVDVRADSWSQGYVGARVFLGRDLDDDPTDNFDGSEMLAIADASSTAPMAGRANDGWIDVELGRAPLELALPDTEGTVTLQVSLARARFERDGDGIRGRLGGALLEDQVRDVLVPFVARGFQNILDQECAGGCSPQSRGQLLLDLFDDDGDGAIGVDEFANSSTIRSLLAPDVDMFDEDGRVNPGCDGVKDALSLALWFTAVPARFDAPPW